MAPTSRPSDRVFLEAVSRLVSCNPFLPERLAYERDALGDEFERSAPVWSFRVADPDRPAVNVRRIQHRLEALLPQLREHIGAGTAGETDRRLYQYAALFLLFYTHIDALNALVAAENAGVRSAGPAQLFKSFRRDRDRLLDAPGVAAPGTLTAAHLFASSYQVARAFHHIFTNIVGTSLVAARLRAAVWQSIFTHDLRRYLTTTLHTRMQDVTTLVTGPSGTGKELVARAIGLSGYLPFDETALAFEGTAGGGFHALNLAAMPATLIESELFGHRRGAFTGALADRKGWLEVCEAGGAVFLDEIGELDATVQVKLLRVLETRTFQPLGGTATRRFLGKIIAATNRDLQAGMRSGGFRPDLYYRLCADVIVTPPLKEQIRESPEVLGELIRFICNRVAGDDATALAEEVEAYVRTHLGVDYPWPGNIRELEQCVRNVLIRREYQPGLPVARASVQEEISDDVLNGRLTADTLLQRYCTLVFAETGSYLETARRLDLDRRTVRAKIDPVLLARLRGEA